MYAFLLLLLLPLEEKEKTLFSPKEEKTVFFHVCLIFFNDTCKTFFGSWVNTLVLI